MICPVCERDCPADYMTKHHLQTRKVDKHDIETLCRDCHSTIHKLFVNGELRDTHSPLNTIEGLLADPDYAKAVKFIKTLPPGRRLRIKESKRRKRKRGKHV